MTKDRVIYRIEWYNTMPKEGQKSITLGGKTLAALERYYKKELSRSMYKISFAEFVSAHALRDIERDGSSGEAS